MRVFHGIAALAIAALAAPTWAKDEPAETSVICKDGSTPKGGKGACSGHGGVDKKATKAAAKPAEAAAPKEAVSSSGAAEATVICKDGTTSKAGRGACRGHGGVDKKAMKTGAPPAEATAPKEAASSSGAAAEATVVCKDGSTSKGGKGACRGHGGVDKKATKAGAKAAVPSAGASAAAPPSAPSSVPTATTPTKPGAVPAPAAPDTGSSKAAAPANAKNTDPTGAIAKCKDGTYSHAKSHSGACSRHGGVAEWLDKPAQ